MDLTRLALEEIAYEGLEGTTLTSLWKLLQKRRPPIKCAIDKWTKPFIWKQLAQSQYIDFYHVDYDSPKQPDIPKNPGERMMKLPTFWINDHRFKLIGYCQTYYYRTSVTEQIRGEQNAKMLLEEAEEKWGDFLYIVASQEFRQRTLFGQNNPPVIDDVIPVRYIMLEIIGKSRWEGFMQADFLKMYGMDSRTSFHHLKILIRLHLITKQSILLKPPVNNFGGGQPIPPKSTKMLHLSQFSNVYTNNLQKAAAKICFLLENAPDGIMERNELKEACSDVVTFKKIRQWLFQAGYIQYIVNGEIWNADNINPTQVSHFRAGRPCYVNLLKPFDVTDIDDDKDDEFLDYIEHCDDIEPQLVYEETLHHQAYRVIVACREKGVTVKKLAEILCVPFTMARSFIRYFDTKKIGRIVNVDHLKLKLQKIVAIQYLHQSETIQKIQSNQLRIAQHKASLVDQKPDVKLTDAAMTTSSSSLTEQNLELADRLDLTRVSEKSKVSVRHLARKNYVMDILKEKPVFEGMHEMYKSLVSSEESVKSTQGLCCRKTFRKILSELVEEKQILKLSAVIDDRCSPPFAATFYCSMSIDENSPEYFDAVNVTKTRHFNLEKRRELKKSVLEKDTKAKVLVKGIPKSVLNKGLNEGADNPTKIKLDFNEVNDVFSDTDDEDFQKSVPLSTAHDVNSKFLTYARFQKLHVMHIYLWKLVYGVDADIEQLLSASHSLSGDTFIDLVQSRHIWLQHVNGLPEYKEGGGWFNVGDIIALMPLEVTCRVLGIKCWSETAIKYLQDPKKRLLKMCELPPRLKYKLLVSNANKQHIDNCVDLLVLLAQMGLLAVSPTFYPKIRTEIMIYLRREAKVKDTRFSQKTYCHTVLPPGVDKFPETIYRFQSLVDVEKYWTDLQFVCLNTPLGLNRAQRNIKYEIKPEGLSEDDMALGKQGLLLTTKSKGANLGRNYRSFTILKDFQQYYQDKDFENLEPVIFGNGLGAGGLDSVFFGHLAKNWRYGKQRGKVRRNRYSTEKGQLNTERKAKCPNEGEKVSCKKIMVSNVAVQQRRGGKGLKRKLASNKAVLTKKMKMERKKYFDRMIAKRIENVREKIRQKEQNKKKVIRKGKKLIAAMNHDEIDRAALRRMKGIRVSFSEREDAYILLAEIVRAMMKLYDKGQPLEKEHKKVVWQAIRDLLHKEIPESCDKTWQAIDRRARNTKRYPHFLVIYNTCKAELEQDKDFKASLICTKDNWKEKMVSAFAIARESYSRHFNYPIHIDNFPPTLSELHKEFNIEYAHKEDNIGKELHKRKLRSDKALRTSLLEDLIHCSLTAQKLTSYIPAVAFKVFDAYPPEELNEAFEYYKENKLISRYRVDLPRRRSLPISTMTYNLSTTYYRIFEPVIPLRIFQMARSMFLHMREGKVHDLSWKESDIMKLPSYYEKGSCMIDYSNLQGGHVAFILSAIANKKIIHDFTLPDEMTISDEDHFKKLKEGRLNYQRVAFEQRIRRGESLVHKRLKVEKSKDLREKSKDLLEKSKAYHESMISSCSVSENTVHSICKKGSDTDQNDMSPSETNIKESQSIKSAKSLIAHGKKDTVEKKSKSHFLLDSANMQSSTKCNPSEKKCVTFDSSASGDPKTSPFKTTHISKLRQHGVIRGFLKSSNLSYCSYNYFKTLDSDKCRKAKSRGTVKNLFLYTSEAPRSKRRLLADKINMFKETKLHASRTSLSMQRSLTSERFVPTNAMNTHDALVMNPMEILIQSKASGFRNLPKPKKSENLNTIWEGFCDSSNDSDEFQNITVDEYCDMLRKDLKFEEHVIEDHRKIMEKIYSMGLFGIALNDFQILFSTLSEDVLKNWKYHIQMLINLQMVYCVGHFEELLVSPSYYYSWCFRSPQVVSRFEEKLRIPAGSSIENIVQPSINRLNPEIGTVSNDSPEKLQSDDSHSKGLSSGDETIRNEESIEDECSEGSESTVPMLYKNVKVLPWLKLSGETNNVLLKRIQETILSYIMANPGVLEADILDNFALLLKPVAAQRILHFLEINGAISRHYQWKKKARLFDSITDHEAEECEMETYIMPTMQCLLNMTDASR